MYIQTNTLVGLLLPTIKGTKISFLKTILCDEKNIFKYNQIKLIEIPNYLRISVTNINRMQQKMEIQWSTFLPRNNSFTYFQKRSIFFGVFCPLRDSYLREIIEEAHKKRCSISPEVQKKLISKTLLTELKKHLYLSRKSGTCIFLIKEQAKIERERKSQTIYEVIKRFYKDVQKPDEMNIDAGAGTKRKENIGPSKPQEEEKKEKANPFMGQFNM